MRNSCVGPVRMYRRARVGSRPCSFLLRVEALEDRHLLSFLPAINYRVGPEPYFMAADDFRGIGILDLAVPNHRGGTVSVLLGNGDGTFQGAVDYPAGPSPIFIVAGRFRRADIVDLAVSNDFAGTVTMLLGNGDGTFQKGTTFSVGQRSNGIAAADLDGDGKLDLVITDASNYDVKIFFGNGGGTFRAGQSYFTATFAGGVAVGDFRNAGLLDLAVINQGSDSVSVLLGNGDGTNITLGHFRSPDTLDIATANFSFGGPNGTVSVLLGNGDGTFQDAVNYDVDGNAHGVAVGDLRGIGITDLVVAGHSDNTVNVLLGNGDGTFQPATTYAVGSMSTSVVVGDFDGDGTPDLAVTNAGSNDVSVLINDGQWTPPPPAPPGIIPKVKEHQGLIDYIQNEPGAPFADIDTFFSHRNSVVLGAVDRRPAAAAAEMPLHRFSLQTADWRDRLEMDFINTVLSYERGTGVPCNACSWKPEPVERR